MNIINVKNSTLKVPEIALGCMRISDMTQNDLNKLITTSLDNGINFFDHADIYGGENLKKYLEKL